MGNDTIRLPMTPELQAMRARIKDAFDKGIPQRPSNPGDMGTNCPYCGRLITPSTHKGVCPWKYGAGRQAS